MDPAIHFFPFSLFHNPGSWVVVPTVKVWLFPSTSSACVSSQGLSEAILIKKTPHRHAKGLFSK